MPDRPLFELDMTRRLNSEPIAKSQKCQKNLHLSKLRTQSPKSERGDSRRGSDLCDSANEARARPDCLVSLAGFRAAMRMVAALSHLQEVQVSVEWTAADSLAYTVP